MTVTRDGRFIRTSTKLFAFSDGYAFERLGEAMTHEQATGLDASIVDAVAVYDGTGTVFEVLQAPVDDLHKLQTQFRKARKILEKDGVRFRGRQ